MFPKSDVAGQPLYPVNPIAVADKDLSVTQSFTIQTFELCTICGARFGIGFQGKCPHEPNESEMEELPKRLTEILSKDHRQNRAHKRVIDLDF